MPPTSNTESPRQDGLRFKIGILLLNRQATRSSMRRPALLRRLPSVLRTREFWSECFGCWARDTAFFHKWCRPRHPNLTRKQNVFLPNVGMIPTYSTRQSFTGFVICAVQDFWELQVRRKSRYECCIREHQHVTSVILKAPHPECCKQVPSLLKQP